jgi:hypothetical protein
MRATRLHATACALALIVPWLWTGSTAGSPRFPGWPAEIDGMAVRPVAMTTGEQALARDFPGRMAKLTDGRRHIILRFIERDTRLFHPAAECMRNLGYEIRVLPTIVDASGRRWGAFEATRAGQRLLVRERIYEASGHGSWTDVSSWYWAAILKRSPGPWWSILVAEASS